MSEWITDRLPTKEETNLAECIIVPRTWGGGWTSRHFQRIKLGDPWAPWPKMPPYKSDEELARESLPEGWKFVGRGDPDNPLFTDGREAIAWDCSRKRSWGIPSVLKGALCDMFYAIPEDPELPADQIPNGYRAEHRGKGWENNGKPCRFLPLKRWGF